MQPSEKLQIKPGHRVVLLGRPASMTADLIGGASEIAEPRDADVVIAFAAKAADLDTVASSAVTAARENRIAWVAYPKGGQLGTDLNRDRLAAAVKTHGVQPVRQIAIDEVWSALRLRPT